jgi:hypothetical protein
LKSKAFLGIERLVCLVGRQRFADLPFTLDSIKLGLELLIIRNSTKLGFEFLVIRNSYLGIQNFAPLIRFSFRRGLAVLTEAVENMLRYIILSHFIELWILPQFKH